MKLLWLLVAVAVWAPPGNQGQEYFECEVSGDPHVDSLTGQRATIPFPCFYKAAGLKMITYPLTNAAALGYEMFIVDVFTASGMEANDGRYFIDHVWLNITAYTNQSGEMQVKANGIYKLNGSRVESFWNGDIEASELWEVEGNFPPLSIVHTGYDGGLAQVSLLWKNNPPLEVSFRPFNKSAKIPQTPKPGVFMKMKKGRPRAMPENRFPHSICSQPWDTRTYKIIKANTVQGKLDNNRQLMLWAALRQNHPQTHPKCVDVMKAFQGCMWWNRKLTAVRECANYTERATVRCMESQGTEPGTALEAVTQCLTASCKFGAARDAAKAWLQNKAC